MRILPLTYCPTLSEEDIYRHECSDRIWVPQNMFERWLTAEDVGSVVIVKLESIAACMYAPHTGPRHIIYAPTWMCEALGTSLEHSFSDEDTRGDNDSDEIDDDFIVPERLQVPTCTFVRVQPHTSDHLPSCVGGSGGEAMPEETLSRAFEEYTCLQAGQTMMLHLPKGDRMFVTIVETQPHQSGPLCIRNTEIAMDLLEPLDRQQTQRPPTPIPEPVPLLTIPEHFPIEDLPTITPSPEPQPHQQETREERRERFARAALARLQNGAPQ